MGAEGQRAKVTRVRLPMLHYYFSDYDAEEHVDPSAPRSGDLRKVLAVFATMSEVEGNTFGVETTTGVIQFVAGDDYLWEVDVPLPERGGSLNGLRLEQGSCARLVVFFAEGGQPSAIEGLKFTKWEDAS
jgi:hypothetical protein